MKLVLVMFEYFPYGGLQRDCLRVARVAMARGHRVEVLVTRWVGNVPGGLKVTLLRAKGLSNHARMAAFARTLADVLPTTQADLVLGFNRLPGIDAYFASDSCLAERLSTKSGLARGLPRYRTYLELEQATLRQAYCFFLNEDQRAEYQRHYNLPQTSYEILPPGIDQDRRRPANAAQLRQETRRSLGLTESQKAILFLGSGFRVKGLDRALAALSSLPPALARDTRLLIAGNDRATPYLSHIAEEDLQRIQVLGPSDDVPALMQAADLLLHPAYRESAGLTLLEAATAGLPVLTTDTCGYARYVRESGAGEVISSPFRQSHLNEMLAMMLSRVPGDWAAAGINFGRQPWLYHLPDTVVDRLESLLAYREGQLDAAC